MKVDAQKNNVRRYCSERTRKRAGEHPVLVLIDPEALAKALRFAHLFLFPIEIRISEVK